MRLDSCAIPYLILLIFVALCLHERSTDFTHLSVRHFGFTIRSLWSPLRGQFCSISFFNYLFISFVKCKYCSLVFFFFFFIDFRSLMKAKGESAWVANDLIHACTVNTSNRHNISVALDPHGMLK